MTRPFVLEELAGTMGCRRDKAKSRPLLLHEQGEGPVDIPLQTDVGHGVESWRDREENWYGSILNP